MTHLSLPRRRPGSRGVLLAAGFAALAVGILGAGAGPVSAVEPAQQGWWSLTGVGSPTVAVPTPLPASTAPDVPPDGLLVQGGASADAPTALSALVYRLSPDERPGPLTLTVAASSGTTPNATLRLCPLTDADFTTVRGGAMSEAPAYSCQHDVKATPDAAGTTYRFDVTPLVRDDLLAIAVLPGGPSDRVVLEHPSDVSLPVEGSTTSGNGSSFPLDTAEPPTFADSGGLVTAPPSVDAMSPPEVAAPDAGTGASDVPGAATVATDPSSGRPAWRNPGWLLVAAIAIAASLWRQAGEPIEMPVASAGS